MTRRIAGPLLLVVPFAVLLGLEGGACSAGDVPVPGRTEAALAAMPPLGAAESFGVLAGSTVTNTGLSTIIGDVGVSPGTAIVGFPPGEITGTFHSADAVAADAQADLCVAYDDLAGQPCGTVLTDMDLGGMTLMPGVYCFASSAQLTGTLTLDGMGDSGAVFVFQIGSTLTTATSSAVTLIGNAIPGRVFWQVGSSATLGTGTQFSGNILAMASITVTTGGTIAGRALARTGAVTLDTVNIDAVATTGGTGGSADAGTDAGEGTGADAGTDPGEGTDAGAACVPCGEARTKGYWANRGLSLISASDLAALSSLDLRNPGGSEFDPTTAAELSDFLQGAHTRNMANMLSAQLAALVLNTLHGLLDPGCSVLASGTTSADAEGIATVAALIAEADAALAADGYTPSGDMARAVQEALKNAADAANNMVGFVACD